jgi:putative transposase
MLTEETLRAWCQRNQMTRETATYMQRLRASQPVRQVRRGVANVTGRYPSVKMGCALQFESQYVALWGIDTMERDDDGLEYFDQPTRLQLHYQARSGRKTSPWHTPDFFVVRRDGAGCEAWKPAAALAQLGRRMPARYPRKGASGWPCPPGEAAAHPLGLYYRVRTSAAYHPFDLQNLTFLQDFWPHSFHVDAGQDAQVLAALSAYPGVSVAAWLDAHPPWPVDVVWALVTSPQICTDSPPPP